MYEQLSKNKILQKKQFLQPRYLSSLLLLIWIKKWKKNLLVWLQFVIIFIIIPRKKP